MQSRSKGCERRPARARFGPRNRGPARSSASANRPTPSRTGLRRSATVAAAALTVLNVADLVTTRLVLAHASVTEGNPIARALLPYHRVDAAKLVILAAIALRTIAGRPSLVWTCLLWFATGYYTLAVISNVLLLTALP